MHEYYRHHANGTLRSELVKLADELTAAGKEFQKEARKYFDQPFLPGQSAAAYQDSLGNALETLKELSDAAKRWNYEQCAIEVLTWMNSRACQARTVFRSMASLGAVGAARYTQDVPPGFLDRTKEDTPLRGSNRYGDLLFWQEVVKHAKSVGADAVVVVTRDRKEDWFVGGTEPELDLAWKRVRAKWLPVPDPHPTLAFELMTEANAELLLLDELYLGALLWKFGRPRFERLAAVAISVESEHFERVDPPPRPISVRAQKRREQATLGLSDANRLFDAALSTPAERVSGLLADLDQDAPEIDAFIEKLGVDTLAPLSLHEAANLTRLLHDQAREKTGPVVAATNKVLNLLDEMTADVAAASYMGFLCSAYLTDGTPVARPRSPFLEDIFDWQTDPAMYCVLRSFAFKLKRLRSAALYIPSGKPEELEARFEHNAEQQQDPIVLTQIYIKQHGLLVEGELRPEYQLRKLVGSSKATVRDLARVVSRFYGLPFASLNIRGGDADDLRFIPDLVGLRDLGRFDQAEAHTPPLINLTDEAADDADDDRNEDEEDDELVEEE